jgi:predicted RNase H-like nuclease
MSNQARDNGWVAGVDGCPAGWMVVFARVNEGEGSGELRLCVLPRFADILCADEAPAVIAVDIPIGLPAQAGRGGRAAENMVRPLLGERQSSVFSVPSRAALEPTDYGEACAVALATSQPPRKISKQLFMIVPKIREVDACLATSRQRRRACSKCIPSSRSGASMAHTRSRSPRRSKAAAMSRASRSGDAFLSQQDFRQW